MAPHLLREQEVTYTNLYARAVDHFLFQNDEAQFGALLNQGPSHKQARNSSPERADIYVVS